jgi:outer membrane protein TolC
MEIIRMKYQQIKSVISVSVVLFSTISALFGQPIRLMKLSDAINYALRNNITKGLADNQVDMQRLNIDIETASLYPEISVQLNANHNFIEPARPEAPTFSDQQQPDNGSEPGTSDLPATLLSQNGSATLGWQISSRYSMLNFAQSMAQIKSAEFTYQSENAQRERQFETVQYEVIQHYLDLLKQEEFIAAEKGILKTQQQQLEQIRQFYDVGKRTEADYLLQKADILQSEYNLLQAENDFASQKIVLNKTIGLTDTAGIRYQGLFTNRIIREIEASPLFRLQQLRIPPIPIGWIFGPLISQ